VVTVEQGEERALGTGSTLHTSETEIRPGPLEVSKIPQEFLDPKGSSFTDSGELGRLEVGETKSREVPVLLGESGQSGNDDSEFRQEDAESFSEEDEVRVVGNVT